MKKEPQPTKMIDFPLSGALEIQGRKGVYDIQKVEGKSYYRLFVNGVDAKILGTPKQIYAILKHWLPQPVSNE